MPPFQIPADAARDANGDLANRAAWGISPQAAQPGSYNPANAPQVDWNALRASNFGGLYNGMDQTELDRIIAQSQANFQRTGVLDSNLSDYLNNRDTARGMGLIGSGAELDMNQLFGGQTSQNLLFGPDELPVQYTTAGGNATNNLGRVMGAMGGGQYNNLGANMMGFNSTPNYGAFGNQSALGLQQTLLRNGLNRGLGILDVANQIENPTTARAVTPSNRFDQTNFSWQAPQNVDNGAPAAGGNPAAPTAPVMQPGQSAVRDGRTTNGYGAYGYDAGAGGGGRGDVGPQYSPGRANSQTGAFGNTPYNPSWGTGLPQTGGTAPTAPNAPSGNSPFTPTAPSAPAPTDTRGPRNGGTTQSGTSSTGGYNPTGMYNPWGSGMRGGTMTGGSAGQGPSMSGPNSYNQGPQTPQNNSGSLNGLGNLYNNLANGQGLGPTGMNSRRRANNSMWGW